ncbi:MAG TPA: superoxide dismutase family protein [Burkholderiales bacterium]|nr:superoxide dismutase family protein [Burkholderiales bacterium]
MKTLLTAATLFLVLAGCAGMDGSTPPAIARLQPTRGNQVGGTVTFTQKGAKVLVVANVHGLAPGLHGFAIYQNGDCSAANGMSAGPIFNPLAKKHGAPGSAEHKAGDLGNLTADHSGNATFTYEASGIALNPNAYDSIINRSVIVHADPDDLISQPDGNSGARVACGVLLFVDKNKSGYSGY